jgi:3-hydroxyacyl-[acyl-carrier-protein] dehydratase
MAVRHEATLSVPADHPALPGHFPDAPVVPGVLLMELILQSTEAWLQRPLAVAGLRQVKFHAPLLPDERAELAVDLEGDTLAFRVARGEQLIARGVFLLGLPASPASAEGDS